MSVLKLELENVFSALGRRLLFVFVVSRAMIMVVAYMCSFFEGV